MQIYKFTHLFQEEHTSEPQKIETVTEPHNITKRDIQNPLVINSKIDTSPSPEIASTDDVWETTWQGETTTELPAEELKTNDPEKVSLPIQEIQRDQKNYRIFIKMKNRLEKGKSYIIDIKFGGDILNNLIGLYKTSYVDLDGITRLH